MIKQSIQQKDITIINIYALNNRAPRHMRQTLTEMKEEVDHSTMITHLQ